MLSKVVTELNRWSTINFGNFNDDVQWMRFGLSIGSTDKVISEKSANTKGWNKAVVNCDLFQSHAFINIESITENNAFSMRFDAEARVMLTDELGELCRITTILTNTTVNIRVWRLENLQVYGSTECIRQSNSSVIISHSVEPVIHGTRVRIGVVLGICSNTHHEFMSNSSDRFDIV